MCSEREYMASSEDGNSVDSPSVVEHTVADEKGRSLSRGRMSSSASAKTAQGGAALETNVQSRAVKRDVERRAVSAGPRERPVNTPVVSEKGNVAARNNIVSRTSSNLLSRAPAVVAPQSPIAKRLPQFSPPSNNHRLSVRASSPANRQAKPLAASGTREAVASLDPGMKSPSIIPFISRARPQLPSSSPGSLPSNGKVRPSTPTRTGPISSFPTSKNATLLRPASPKRDTMKSTGSRSVQVSDSGRNRPSSPARSSAQCTSSGSHSNVANRGSSSSCASNALSTRSGTLHATSSKDSLSSSPSKSDPSPSRALSSSAVHSESISSEGLSHSSLSSSSSVTAEDTCSAAPSTGRRQIRPSLTTLKRSSTPTRPTTAISSRSAGLTSPKGSSPGATTLNFKSPSSRLPSSSTASPKPSITLLLSSSNTTRPSSAAAGAVTSSSPIMPASVVTRLASLSQENAATKSGSVPSSIAAVTLSSRTNAATKPVHGFSKHSPATRADAVNQPASPALRTKPVHSPSSPVGGPTRPNARSVISPGPRISMVPALSSVTSVQHMHSSGASSQSFVKTKVTSLTSTRRGVKTLPCESPKTLSSSRDDSNLDASVSGSVTEGRKVVPEGQSQRLRIAGFKRSPSSPIASARIAPEELHVPPMILDDKKRCGWITSLSDGHYIAYHDNEWGVPIYDDKLLFELMVLQGAQAELSWPAILARRDNFRAAFADFEPAVIATFHEKKMMILGADISICFPEAKVRGAVDNAKLVLEIIEEYGSFSKFLWSFVNHKPIVSHYKLAKQVPVKTPRSEALSKELVRRGFRFVGPTTMYSVMQAAGMVNDHLVTCFKHQDHTGEKLAATQVVPEAVDVRQCGSVPGWRGPTLCEAIPQAEILDFSFLEDRQEIANSCKPVWAELPMIEEVREEELERLTEDDEIYDGVTMRADCEIPVH